MGAKLGNAWRKAFEQTLLENQLKAGLLLQGHCNL